MVSSIKSVDLSGRRVLIRADFNVPFSDGRISEKTRIIESLQTIRYALQQGAGVILCSHLGRPEEGVFDSEFSLQPVADELSKQLALSVSLIRDWNEQPPVKPGQVVLWENVRFNTGEMRNCDKLGQMMAQHADVFVLDAFASAHREHASTVAVVQAVPYACVGLLLERELSALRVAFEQPKRPLVAVVGGAKISTKIQLLEALLDQVDVLIVGGGIANTFLKAAGYAVGGSLVEDSCIELAQRLMKQAQEKGVVLPLPKDVYTAGAFSADEKPRYRTVDAVAENEMILDVGELTTKQYTQLIQSAGTTIWNGPIGVFEFPAFAAGTRAIGEAIAESACYSVAGGGDTLAALAQFSLGNSISYVSTGGGAFLHYLQEGRLPAVEVINKKEESFHVK
jgi:phosphoglycerate kinase